MVQESMASEVHACLLLGKHNHIFSSDEEKPGDRQTFTR